MLINSCQCFHWKKIELLLKNTCNKNLMWIDLWIVLAAQIISVTQPPYWCRLCLKLTPHLGKLFDLITDLFANMSYKKFDEFSTNYFFIFLNLFSSLSVTRHKKESIKWYIWNELRRIKRWAKQRELQVKGACVCFRGAYLLLSNSWQEMRGMSDGNNMTQKYSSGAELGMLPLMVSASTYRPPWRRLMWMYQLCSAWCYLPNWTSVNSSLIV